MGGQSRNCRFVIVDAPSSYNAIFGRPLISAFRCVPSSFHQCLKFNTGGVQVRIRGDPRMARQCYVTAVNTISWMADAEKLEKELEEKERQEEEEGVRPVEREQGPEEADEEMIVAREGEEAGAEARVERVAGEPMGLLEDSVENEEPGTVIVHRSRKRGREEERSRGPSEAMGIEDLGGEKGASAKEKGKGPQEEEEEGGWETQGRLMPALEVVEMEVHVRGGQVERVKISGELSHADRQRMLECIQRNVDVFAWSAADMPGVDADVACHRLNLDPKIPPIRQKRRKIADKLEEPIRAEVEKLLKAGFVKEIQYPGWVSNVVMVEKGDGRWRMCVDFSLMNKACPKDCYPLPRIDALVDSAVGFLVMSFLDAFSGYHQIRMHPPDVKDVSFITGDGCYCFIMMPFGLRNAGATYQKLMDRVFKKQKGRNLEVYVDDLMVKSRDVTAHLEDLEETFATLRRYKMKLNPLKCVFGASRGKFLGHLITPTGVEPNPDKVKAIVELESPRNPKEVQRLTGKLAGLSRFLSRAGEKCYPFFRVLRGNQKFEWTKECEEAFQALKSQLTKAPVLQGPKEGEDLSLYLGVGAEAVSSILV